jgi:hypothetical protein
LQYYDKSLALGEQTIRPGQVGPVSSMLGGVTLTGCFLHFNYFVFQLLVCDSLSVKPPFFR